ncbi:MAG: hypothetical protein ACR2MG_17120 [Pyrinomonadaceae bacterium]
MKDETKKDNQEEDKAHKEKFVNVAVITTSGSYPDHGFEQIPENQKVRVILEKATKHLKIADTKGWIALVDEKEINIEASFADNNLHSKVEIDFGPREGGGGCA